MKIKLWLVGLVSLLILGTNTYLIYQQDIKRQNFEFGVSFSQKRAEEFGLDWKRAYLAILDELKVKKIRLSAYWDIIEPERNQFNFADLEWQIEEAKKRGAEILLVVGRKTPGWPECHLPQWLKQAPPEEFQRVQEERLLLMLKKVTNHFKEYPNLWAWQLENEPYFPFGICPKIPLRFLKQEITVLRQNDPVRPIIITDSGEWGIWIIPALQADIVGTTMYRNVWNKFIGYTSYPLPPFFYWLKKEIIKITLGKPVINTELQAEPWAPDFKFIAEIPLKEQYRTMNKEKLLENIAYARKTGINMIYLWGAEWWYWLKQEGKPEMWEEAKRIFLKQ